MASLTRLASDKRQFANRARDFVNHARRTQGFPALELVCLGVAGLAMIAGAFGTSALPLAQRAIFWFTLMGWSAIKWRLWFAWMVRQPADWARAAMIGAVLLNLPLPLEIGAAMAFIDVDVEIGRVVVWLEALVISAIVAALIWSLRRLLAPATGRTVVAEPGPLVRAGARIEQVAAVRAEDHYCRIYLVDGASRLVLCRFGDALAELAHLNGERVHRGAWVADRAVERAVREGRAWRLVVAGEPFAVSAAHVAEARRRGWLNRR